MDTLFNPMFPDATTAKEMYCNDYPTEECKRTRKERLYIWLSDYLSSSTPCVIFLLSGAQPLDAYNPLDKFENPLNGMISSMILQLGGKANGIRRTPFFWTAAPKKRKPPWFNTTFPCFQEWMRPFETVAKAGMAI